MYRGFLISFLISTVALGAHLPPSIKICKPSDEKCLIENGQRAFQAIVGGLEDFGIPPLEPVLFLSFKVEPIPGPINLYQEYTNVKFAGISKATLEKVMVNLENCAIYLEAAGDMVVTANYVLKGQLLIIPVDMKGVGTMKMKSMRPALNITCELQKKGDDEFVHVTGVALVLNIGGFEMKLDSETNGNEVLKENVQHVLDDSPGAFFEVMRPTVEDIWNIYALETYNTFFSQIPLKELFQI